MKIHEANSCHIKHLPLLPTHRAAAHRTQADKALHLQRHACLLESQGCKHTIRINRDSHEKPSCCAPRSSCAGAPIDNLEYGESKFDMPLEVGYRDSRYVVTLLSNISCLLKEAHFEAADFSVAVHTAEWPMLA